MFPDDTSSTTVSALTAPAPYTHTDVHYGHPRAGTEKVRARQRAKFFSGCGRLAVLVSCRL